MHCWEDCSGSLGQEGQHMYLRRPPLTIISVMQDEEAVVTPKELETSRHFTGESSNGLIGGFSASPRRQAASSRTAFSELNGDVAHSGRREPQSSTSWMASLDTEAHMPQTASYDRTAPAQGPSERRPGGSPQAVRSSQHRPALSSLDSYQRQSMDVGSSLAARQPSSAARSQEDWDVERGGRDGAGKATLASTGRPATSHFVLQPSLTQSSGHNSSLATARGGQEHESRQPTASTSGPTASAMQHGRVSRQLHCPLPAAGQDK